MFLRIVTYIVLIALCAFGYCGRLLPDEKRTSPMNLLFMSIFILLFSRLLLSIFWLFLNLMTCTDIDYMAFMNHYEYIILLLILILILLPVIVATILGVMALFVERSRNKPMKLILYAVILQCVSFLFNVIVRVLSTYDATEQFAIDFQLYTVTTYLHVFVSIACIIITAVVCVAKISKMIYCYHTIQNKQGGMPRNS